LGSLLHLYTTQRRSDLADRTFQDSFLVS
jgi:hypothetical protein